MESKFFNNLPGKLAKGATVADETKKHLDQSINLATDYISKNINNLNHQVNKDLNGLAQVVSSDLNTIKASIIEVGKRVTSNEESHRQEMRAGIALVVVLNILILVTYLLVK